LGQIAFEHLVNHRDGIEHERVVGRTNAQPHQVKKIATDDVPR
jgi:hypothetical protein